jgi:hypothetical protein
MVWNFILMATKILRITRFVCLSIVRNSKQLEDNVSDTEYASLFR